MFLYELLYRGNPDGTGTFHVVLAVRGGTDSFGRPLQLQVSDAMTPEQATTMGFPLPNLLAAINGSLSNTANQLQGLLDESKAAVQSKQEQLDAAVGIANEKQALLDAALATNSTLRAQLEDALKPPAEAATTPISEATPSE